LGRAISKKALIPFINYSGNPSFPLLVSLLWAVFSVSPNFSSQLARKMLRRSGKS
jgi:hypothetical protein